MQVSKPTTFEVKLGAALSGKKFTLDNSSALESALLVGAQSCALEIGSTQSRATALAALSEAFNDAISKGDLSLPALIGEGTFKRVTAEKGEPSYKFSGLVANWRACWRKCAVAGRALPDGVTLNAHYQELLKLEKAKTSPAANSAPLEQGAQVQAAMADELQIAAFNRVGEIAVAIKDEASKTAISKKTLNDLAAELIRIATEFSI